MKFPWLPYSQFIQSMLSLMMNCLNKETFDFIDFSCILLKMMSSFLLVDTEVFKRGLLFDCISLLFHI